MKPDKIALIGLGYVGLPIAVEMAKHFTVTGYDINESRIKAIQKGEDPNGEVKSEDLAESTLRVSSDPSVIEDADVIIVTVPTPIDVHNDPDLTPLIKASEAVGKNLKKGAIVVYESTVYPGATEDKCVPVLEKFSKMKWKKDFNVGYSPERINPGDTKHPFSEIMKIVSGDSPKTLDIVAQVYEKVVTAGVYRASSIKTAEAAKVIENTQRDINIALMNELRIIFDKLGLSTKEVLEAAGTKWNFLPFEPGLVGGHCIGIDPYYLAYKAEEVGHHPQIVMAGRRINDAMGRYFAREMIKKLMTSETKEGTRRVLVCGITFKENCPDIRNTRVVDIVSELESFGISVDVWDPAAYPEDVKREYGIDLTEKPEKSVYDGVILAVKHREFLEAGKDGILSFCRGQESVFYDIKEVF